MLDGIYLCSFGLLVLKGSCFQCTAPCAEGHSAYPAAVTSSIDKGPLINSVKPYSRHLMFCAGSGDGWPSHIEEGGSPKSFLHMVDAGLDAGNARLKQAGLSGGRTMLSAIDKTPEGNSEGSEHVSTVERTEVFFFPEFKTVRGVSSDEVSKIVEDWVATKSFEASAEDIEYDAMIFVCTHKKRDKRCGVTGPLLMDEFNNVIHELGLADKVACIGISHIGGHKFAGNLIVYSRKFPQGVWYGRVVPCHAENIVKKTVLEGKVFKELYRGQGTI
ncbi:hypothetical protein HDU83_009164 [Entophlyctis luteolus]|nr:hypothetical protein HDU83_009164 [Entophlyctis luteolus]